MKKSEVKYYVIGGQYEGYNHGGAKTLLGAKRLAARCDEHWDNQQGWNRPAIYKAEDCELGTNFFGEQMLPTEFSEPVCVWSPRDGKWVPYQGM